MFYVGNIVYIAYKDIKYYSQDSIISTKICLTITKN